MRERLEHLNIEEHLVEIKSKIGKEERGVSTTRPLDKGDWVVEYQGKIVEEASNNYTLEFLYESRWILIDAAEAASLCGLLNHSRAANCRARVVEIGGKPHAIIMAVKAIKVGEELLWDYNDRSKASREANSWL